jgi:hypothetical protein
MPFLVAAGSLAIAIAIAIMTLRPIETPVVSQEV